MKKPGIHFRILLAAFILISASTFTLGAMGVSITRKFMNTRFKDRISFLARYLALNSEVGVLIGDRTGLKNLAFNLLGEKDVAGVTILDNHSNKLVDISRRVQGSLSSIESPVIFKKFREENIVFTSDTGAEPPIAEVIGKVIITYSTYNIDNLMRMITSRLIWFSACLTGLAGLVFYLISRPIVIQVTKLADTARQVAQGDLDLRTSIGSLPETRELAVAFNQMLDSLARSREALARAKEDMMRQNSLAEMGKFSLMIAHELKNPLGIIKGSLDILKKNPALPTSETMMEYMEDEIKRLNRLIEDFLSFARPARPSFRPVDANAMLKEIVERFELQNIDTFIEIQSQIPSMTCQINADPDLITRALSNIIKNAFEANKQNGGKGVIRVTASSNDSAYIVAIEDEGQGIVTENMEKIFEPFFTTRSKGTGLGLAFASHVIKAHSGKIIAENRKEGGALFQVEIPIKSTESALLNDHSV